MKTCILTLMLIGAHVAALSQQVVQGEYFIDRDAGVGANSLFSVAPAADGTFPFTANLTGIAPGYHTLFIRTQDGNGRWSLTSRSSIEVLPGIGNAMSSGEYFFDTDPGFGAATPITVTARDTVLLQQFTAQLATLAPGYHKLFIRLHDAFSNWGITARHDVQVIADSTGGKVMLVEYFFDTDPGFGNCAFTTFAQPAADGSFSFTIPPANIPDNAVALYMRVNNSGNNDWSLTAFKNYSVLPLSLLSFSAEKNANTALLSWTTTQEVNIQSFVVQRSLDGVHFENRGQVLAKGSGASQNEYQYTDELTELPAGKVFYRLQIKDTDGKLSYSHIADVLIATKASLFTLAPNPAKDFFFANLGAADTMGAVLTVSDAAGRLLHKQTVRSQHQKVLLPGLAPGTYLVTLYSKQQTATQKLMIQ